MSETLALNAQSRTKIGKQANQLRRDDLIPAVVYGHGFTPRNLSVAKVPFEKIYRQAGESSLVDLAIENEAPLKVLIADTQYDPLRGDVTHIDFRAVRMDEKLEAEITLRFVDESPAMKELGGTLVKNISHVKARCLPSALVHEINVSISTLKTFSDKIHIRDLVLPAGIEVLNPADETVVFVEEPRSEEELKALESTPEVKVEEVKVMTDEKKAEREKEKEQVEKGKE